MAGILPMHERLKQGVVVRLPNREDFNYEREELPYIPNPRFRGQRLAYLVLAKLA